MKPFLLILAVIIFLYSPYGPNWGRDLVNIGLVIGLFSLLGKGVPKQRPYYSEEEEEEYN